MRRQRAPHCTTVDAGITAIYGRIPIVAAEGLAPKEAIEDIFAIASDERKVFLGLGAVRFPLAPDRAASRFAPHLSMQHRNDYVVCIVGGRHEYVPANLHHASASELQRAAVAMLAAWPDRARSLVGAGDDTASFLVEMYTSVPCELDAPSNVTMLGDAVHAMTPTLGRGANLAMRDGALLGRALKRVAAGYVTLGAALAAYERDLLDYGFRVVRKAAQIGAERMAQNPLPA